MHLTKYVFSAVYCKFIIYEIKSTFDESYCSKEGFKLECETDWLDILKVLSLNVVWIDLLNTLSIVKINA